MEFAPFTGYVYPNEGVIQWSVMIVIYPYLTGLVAGAFTVSSFYHVFGMQQFKPVARLALLTSLCVMLFVPVPLLMHLGHPERSIYSMITPHLTSAFAMFGFFAAFYTITNASSLTLTQPALFNTLSTAFVELLVGKAVHTMCLIQPGLQLFVQLSTG
jgi:Ni/Fe-hydrogenase subunit HybB-like protein